MRAFAWLRARPRAVASTGAVTAGVLALTTLAFVYQGRPTTEVDLHDGGVWVTKQSSLMVGHFNHESQVLDGGLRTTTDDYDVLQSGSTVVVTDNADSTITTVDPAMVALSESADVPSGAKVVLGGPTLAILEQATGSLWVLPGRGARLVHGRGHRPHVRTRQGGRRDRLARRHRVRRLARRRHDRHDRNGCRGRSDRSGHEGARRDPRAARRPRSRRSVRPRSCSRATP